MEIISFVKIKRNSCNFYILQSETFRRASLDACKFHGLVCSFSFTYSVLYRVDSRIVNMVYFPRFFVFLHAGRITG